MRAFSSWSPKTDSHYDQRQVIAFDLDDTLTVNGALPAEVIQELENAQARGWTTVLVTGRSAGWVNALIKLLPFDAIVGENGALLSLWRNKKSKRQAREEPLQLFWNPQTKTLPKRGLTRQSAEKTSSGPKTSVQSVYGSTPPTNIRAQHAQATQTILKKFPKAQVASDQAFRIYDLAIDFAEAVNPPLSLATAEKIKEAFESLGATAKVSSIHVNGWWGNFSKVDGLKELLEKFYSQSIEENLIYVGDSPNDGPLFEAAGMSVGVANIKHFLGHCEFQLPAFITRGAGGLGSIQILKALPRLKRRGR